MEGSSMNIPIDGPVVAASAQTEQILAPLYKREQDAYRLYVQALHQDTVGFQDWMQAHPQASQTEVVAAYETTHIASRRAQNAFIHLFLQQDIRVSRLLGI